MRLRRRDLIATGTSGVRRKTPGSKVELENGEEVYMSLIKRLEKELRTDDSVVTMDDVLY